MPKAFFFLVDMALLFSWAGIPAQAVAADSLQLPQGSTIPVILTKGIDARKNKVGDEIIAKTTEQLKSDGRVVVPRGAKIIGRMTVAKGWSKEDPQSELGIVFDHAVLKDGSDLPLSLEIQAVAPDQTTALPVTMSMGPATPAGSAGGSIPVPGRSSNSGPMSDPNAGTPGRIDSPMKSENAASGSLTPRGSLTPSCHGVLGIDGLALVSETENPAVGSVIVSRARNVHLDGGTQMMLRVLAK